MKKFVFIIALLYLSVFNFAGTKPYVILVSFDAFRWDYLNRGITPNLDIVRNSGVAALSLRPSFPSKTFPNHLSIITGMYPAHHGIIANSFEDPFTNIQYRMGDTNTVTDDQWYLGEAFWETAERQGIKTASFFWPGSEVKLSHRHPTYFKKYEHTLPYENRIDGIINWLQLPQDKRPHFLTLYMHETNEAGHTYGPNSVECNNAIKKLDGLTGLLFKKLEEIKMKDSVDVIFVSDHGMTEVSDKQVINIEKIIAGYNYKIKDESVLMTIDVPREQLNEVFTLLKKNENHYKVYRREEVPSYFHFSDHPFITPLVLIPDLGWLLVSEKNAQKLLYEKGDHGYDNNQLDMHGILLAEGPSFKKGYKTGTLWNIDIYPLLCKIFGIMPRTNIDGMLERIEFILN